MLLIAGWTPGSVSISERNAIVDVSATRLWIPEDVSGEELDQAVRQELKGLPKTLADDVSCNLVMVGDP